MNRTWMALLALACLSAAAPSGADEFSHPDRVLAGVWQIPIFYTPGRHPSEPITLRAAGGGDSARVLLDRLPDLGLGPRYAVTIEEPFLTDVPGSTIRLELLAGETPIASGTIEVESHPSITRLLSVEEGGSVVLWAEDGAGGLLPLDTVRASSPVREALLLRAWDGTVRIIGATDAGEAVIWAAGDEVRLVSRVPIGGQVSAATAGPSSLEGYFGLLDGRIVRVRPEGGEAEVVVSANGIPTSLAVGDADGDEVDDIAATVLEMDRSDMVVWRGTGGGQFDRDNPRVVLLPGTGRAVLFAPIAGEERLLLLCHGADVGLSSVSLWGADEADTVSGVELPGLPEKRVHRMVQGDWNGDGTGDLAVLTGGSRSVVEFFLLDRKGARGRPVSAVPVSGPEIDLLAADLDGNGADDLLTAEGAFHVWLSDGTGRMTALSTPPRSAPTRLGRLALD